MILELYTWSNEEVWCCLDTKENLVSTYDVLSLDSYKYATYNGVFHLLAGRPDGFKTWEVGVYLICGRKFVIKQPDVRQQAIHTNMSTRTKPHCLYVV